MAMRIRWSGEADHDLEIAVIQCREKFGSIVATKFYHQVKSNEKYLLTHPCIGKVEPLAESTYDPLTYRSLVVHEHYKIVYVIEEDDDVIRIVKFWDTRRNPVTLIEDI